MKTLVRKKVLIIIMLISGLYTYSSEPLKRVIVAKDNSGDFLTIQDAVNSVRDYNDVRTLIYIKNGEYREKLEIPSWKTNIALIGESAERTIIVYDDYSGKGDTRTFTSYSVKVMGNDFYAENITFENSSGPVGQAVAIHVEADRCVFRNCRFIGNQDTMLANGEGSRQLYSNCYIEGTTDFIFGSATAVFENCHIHSKKNSYVTAASTPEGIKYGYVFLNCTLTADTSVNHVYLGRPWRPFARVVYLKCDLGNHIVPEGWHNWSKPERELTSYYAEYKNTGAGSDTTSRVTWSHQLTEQESAKYTLDTIFADQNNEETTNKKWYLFKLQ